MFRVLEGSDARPAPDGGSFFRNHPGELVSFRIVGSGMNLVYPPGSLVLACPLAAMKHAWVPKPGQRVVVERVAADGARERMVREILVNGDDVFLMPRSDDPAFQRPLRLKMRPDAANDDCAGAEVAIVALVVRLVLEEPGL